MIKTIIVNIILALVTIVPVIISVAFFYFSRKKSISFYS